MQAGTLRCPSTYPGTVEVLTFAGRRGAPAMQTRVEMRLVGSDLLYAEGAAKSGLDGSPDRPFGAAAARTEGCARIRQTANGGSVLRS